jgi:hypothetical protein
MLYQAMIKIKNAKKIMLLNELEFGFRIRHIKKNEWTNKRNAKQPKIV